MKTMPRGSRLWPSCSGSRPSAGPPRPPGSRGPGADVPRGTQVVSLFATVTDRDGRLVPNLNRDDFQVFDNNELQPLVFFEDQIQPITVVVMLDTSGSMTASIPLLRAAAEQFLIRLLPDDAAPSAPSTTRSSSAATSPATATNSSPSSSGLDYGNGTRLWDGVDASLDRLQHVAGRKVVLVFTDGDDTASKTSQGKVTRSRPRRRGDGVRDRPRERDASTRQRMVRTSPTAACAGWPRKPAAAISS